MKNYLIQMEVAGPTAMWTRPDTGDSPVSYPVPTYSAAKGLFESIARIEVVEIIPFAVEICSPIVFHSYVTNYGGPLRKSRVIHGGGSYQLLATVIINVCYRLYAELKPFSPSRPLSERARAQADKGCNALHSLQEIFNRRIERGQWRDTPFLGWSEFTPDYLGPFRDQTGVHVSTNLTLPSLLHHIFQADGSTKPSFRSEAIIRNGRLSYAE